MTFTLPLAIWTLSAFFREIPWDLDKAARVDGATPFQAFRKVIAPLAAPGMFTSAILVFIFAWNDFLFATALDVDQPGPHRPGRHHLLHRVVAVRLPHRSDRRRLGGGHHPDHHHGPDLPAPHRRRADLRRGQGLRPQRGAPPWPRSCSTRSPSVPGRHHRRARGRLHHRRRRVLHPRRALGLREVDAAEHDRRARGHLRRRAPGRRRAWSTTSTRRTATWRWCSRATPSIRT